MTISTTQNQISYTGDGSSLAFAFPYPYITATDLKVYIAGVLQSAGYSVSGTAPAGGSGTFASGTVTFVAAPAAAAAVLIYCEPDLLQSTSIPSNDPFPAKTVERIADKLTLLVQRISARLATALVFPLGETNSGILPAAAVRANTILSFDASGNPVTVAAAAQSATALSVDIGNSASATKGAGQVGFGYAVQYPANTIGAQANWFINAQLYGALADGSTNNTTAVQNALTALGANGGCVQVKRNTKFNLQTLTFPIRSNLEYWLDDDLSRPNPATTLGTNERVLLMANANAGGIVNEYRATAAFHPSFNLDLRRDVPGHDAYLGATQKRIPDASTPGRMSWNMFDQQVDTFRTVAEIYGGAYSNFTGVTSHSWRRTVTITNIGTGAGGFVSVPAVGVEVTGSVSGAKGWFVSATANTTTLLWNSGKFAVGDRLIDDNETTTNAATGVAFAVTPNQPMGTDLRKGSWSIGLPAGLGDELLNLGGRLQVLPTRNFSQFVYKAITHPGLVLVDLVSDVPTNGFVLHYDTTAAAASRSASGRRNGLQAHRISAWSLADFHRATRHAVPSRPPRLTFTCKTHPSNRDLRMN